MNTKKRLDHLLFKRGYFNSRTESRATILSGRVYINNIQADKPGQYFNENKIKDVKIKNLQKYVSRGGEKLEKALKEFSIEMKNKICMDVGCSTGGFTDCLLQNHAEKVYGVDVGYGQFDYKLRNNDKVILLERTNIRYLDRGLIKDKIDIITIDVSFISARKFLHDLIFLCNDGFSIIQLIKPQFEGKREDVKKGVIKSKDTHIKIVNGLLDYFSETGLHVCDFTFSPLKGPKGNIEFFVHLKKEGKDINRASIANIIKEAHEKLFR